MAPTAAPNATARQSDTAPARDRARAQLRECQALMRNLFDAHARMLNRRLGPTPAAGPPAHAGSSTPSSSSAGGAQHASGSAAAAGSATPRSARSGGGAPMSDAERDPVAAADKSEPVVLMKRLIEQQEALRGDMDAVLEHQQLQAVIEQLRRANAVEDAKIAALAASLWAAESLLQNVLDDAKPRLAALKRANKRPVDVDEVISYGSKICASLAAPAGYDEANAGQTMLNHIPPAPTEAMIRDSMLASIANDDLADPALADPALADRPAPPSAPM